MSSVTTPARSRIPSRRAEWRPVAALTAETAADDHVRLVRGDRLEQAGEVARVVLPVAVDLDGDLEAVVARVLVAGLDGAADAEVVRKASRRARRPARASAAVPSVEPSSMTRISKPGIDGADLRDHAGDRRRLR